MNPEQQADIAEKEYAESIVDCSEPSMTPKEYRGLYGEVVLSDCYGFRNVRKKPDFVIDIGANIGTFTLFARELFPDASIISVEPHPTNYYNLASRVQSVDKIRVVNAALGIGPVWTKDDFINGAHACYLGQSLGFNSELFESDPEWKPSTIQTVTIADIHAGYIPAGASYAIKIDCEGAENSIFYHEDSMNVLRRADYFAIEVHNYSNENPPENPVENVINRHLWKFNRTHITAMDTVNHVFTARKKGT